MRFLRIDENSPYRQLVGVGGLGTGIFFKLEGDHTLGRNESRPGRLLDVEDYCKLHIVIHYTARLLGARPSGLPFHVTAVGNIGSDAAGRAVLDRMADVGIDTNCVTVTRGLPTLFSVCFQYPDGTGGNITTSNSAAAAMTPSDVDKLSDQMRSGGQRCIALAVPEVPLELRKHFLQLASRTGAFRAASFVAAEIESASNAGMLNLLDLVALNSSEAEVLLEESFEPESPRAFVTQCQELIKAKYPGLKIVLSAGKTGAFGIAADAFEHFPAPSLEIASTAGAGDALLGAVLAGLAAGIPFIKTEKRKPENVIQSALALGVLVGSYKCQSPHTIHTGASLDTVSAFAADKGLSFSSKIENLTYSDTLLQPAT